MLQELVRMPAGLLRGKDILQCTAVLRQQGHLHHLAASDPAGAASKGVLFRVLVRKPV